MQPDDAFAEAEAGIRRSRRRRHQRARAGDRVVRALDVLRVSTPGPHNVVIAVALLLHVLLVAAEPANVVIAAPLLVAYLVVGLRQPDPDTGWTSRWSEGLQAQVDVPPEAAVVISVWRTNLGKGLLRLLAAGLPFWAAALLWSQPGSINDGALVATLIFGTVTGIYLARHVPTDFYEADGHYACDHCGSDGPTRVCRSCGRVAQREGARVRPAVRLRWRSV